MSVPKPIVLDFETEAIERRPQYPPKPAGVAIKWSAQKINKYYSWAHDSDNNCTKADAQKVLCDAYRSGEPLLFQNGKFDTDVAATHMGLPVPSWERIHDTLFLLFLENPHATSLSLKPSAQRLLGIKPSERDALHTWITTNIPAAKRKPSEAGAYIARAPGSLVGRYALQGDVRSTEKLFRHLYPIISKRGMLEAYDRERHLMPILLRNEQEGIRVDLPRMECDYAVYCAALEKADNWLRKTLGVPGLNLDADKDVGNALDASGTVTEWVYTKPTKGHPQGQRSVAKKNMTLDMFNNAKVASVYGYRTRLKTCLSMFFTPWLEQARATDGFIHTSWNQVRQTHGNENMAGARTGRLSSTPNFQNIPKMFEDRGDGFVHPKFLNVPPLPLMRSYLLPDKGEVWGHRDYSQQELRILAHFEDGALLQAYLADPKLDVHGLVHSMILEKVKRDFIRLRVKQFVFQKIYGGGWPALTAALGCDMPTAKLVVAAMMQALPGYETLEADIKATGRAGLAIRTWGGREYYTEPPKFVKKYGRVMTFDYKLMNYLIQGSAGDCTKEALIRYDEHPKREARMLVSVHDEINSSMAKKRFKLEMELLREVMQSIQFDLPMLSEGKFGNDWGHLTKMEA
jgi:DNA polymerase I-like protein with 3'-5' exonuclease and polymerase domains